MRSGDMRAHHTFSILIVATLLVMAGATSAPLADAGKGKKARTVTKVFANNGQIAIPGAGSSGNALSYPATIHSRGFKKGKIKDVNVTLIGLSHQFLDDVDVLLVAENGRNALVMSDVGGNGNVSGLTYTFDDEAPDALLDEIPFIGDRFQPANFPTSSDDFVAPAPVPSGNAALSVFDGGLANGEWKLFIRDDSDLFTGNIAGGWSLEITARVKSKKKR
jgi:hypothetical protein